MRSTFSRQVADALASVYHGNMRIIKIDGRPTCLDQLDELQGWAFASVINVLLVGNSYD